ncbi:MAG: SRPBCC domain-containing protein [Gammaproteobacteria bacterium]|nr:SRPBCC domain-containing protein [Gammaproteobacteria bacterium]
MPQAENAAAELTMTRLLDAPRELVWQAWTDPEHVQNWWGPHPCTNSDCVIELRVGGAFRLDMHAADGATYPCRGTIREVVAPRRLVIEGDALCPHPCGAGLPPNAIVTLTLDAHGDKTRLTLHTRFPSAAAQRGADDAGFVVGWEATLDRLGDYL